jgi:phosphoglycolate phosphatase
MPQFQHVFFDLDGTLIDHFETIHQSFSFAAQKMGLPIPSYEKVLRTVGGSVPVTASRLFPEADSAQVAELFESHFDEIMFEGVSINPGAEWILKELHGLGIKSIVFTNKQGSKARKICDYLGISNWLTGIIGTGDTPYRKPEKAFSEYILKLYKADYQQACIVGDSPFDEAAAHIVNMSCHLVSTGSHDSETLKKETRSDVFESLYMLGKVVFGLEVPEETS